MKENWPQGGTENNTILIFVNYQPKRGYYDTLNSVPFIDETKQLFTISQIGFIGTSEISRCSCDFLLRLLNVRLLMRKVTRAKQLCCGYHWVSEAVTGINIKQDQLP